eukprot:Pompholyxophrys_sp_v1_NODE_366_length_665_cov_17.468852.p1 type:complete len:127 gc:universal NODE_366_length_665_cov_17.468852:540-160(-)
MVHLTDYFFFNCCKSFLDSGKVDVYPGRNSVWIMDGASIHVDAHLLEYLTNRGIVVIFNAAYCPFYCPLEILDLSSRYSSNVSKAAEVIPFAPSKFLSCCSLSLNGRLNNSMRCGSGASARSCVGN